MSLSVSYGGEPIASGDVVTLDSPVAPGSPPTLHFTLGAGESTVGIAGVAASGDWATTGIVPTSIPGGATRTLHMLVADNGAPGAALAGSVTITTDDGGDPFVINLAGVMAGVSVHTSPISLAPPYLWMIPMQAGSYGNPDNPYGNVTWWFINPNRTGEEIDVNTGFHLWATTPEQMIRNLREHMQEGYDVGARYFMLHQPVGNVEGPSHISCDCWAPIIDDLKPLLAAFLARCYTGEEFGEPVYNLPYIGSGMQEEGTNLGWAGPDDPDDGWQFGSRETQEQIDAFDHVIDYWVGQCKAIGFGLDHSAPNNEYAYFMELAQELADDLGIVLIGEAIPRVSDGAGGYVLRQDALEAMPWCALLSQFDGGYYDEYYTPVNPANTCVYVWPYYGTIMAIANANAMASSIAGLHYAQGRKLITNHPLIMARYLELRNMGRPSPRSRGRSRGRGSRGGP